MTGIKSFEYVIDSCRRSQYKELADVIEYYADHDTGKFGPIYKPNHAPYRERIDPFHVMWAFRAGRAYQKEQDQCPHGCGDMIYGIQGDPLEPEDPYCPECGHIKGRGCDDGCHFSGRIPVSAESSEQEIAESIFGEEYAKCLSPYGMFRLQYRLASGNISIETLEADE